MDPMDQWWDEFTRQHGYSPDSDPHILGAGGNPEDSVREHLRAKQWGEEFQRGWGRPPTADEYRYSQPMRFVNGTLVSGFGGRPPETWGVPAPPAPPEPAKPKAVPVAFGVRGAVPAPPRRNDR